MRKILEPHRLKDRRNTVNPGKYFQKHCIDKSSQIGTHSDMRNYDEF